MLSDDNCRLMCNQCPLCGLRWRQGVACLAEGGKTVGGTWIEKEKEAKRQHGNSSAYVFPRSVCSFHQNSALCWEGLTLSSTELWCWKFRLQSVTLVPNRRRSFTTSSFDIPPYRAGMIDSWVGKKRGCKERGVCILRELVGLLKVVEVLPRYFIFILKYSLHMVDRGNFCSQPAIQKWKGCGLWMKGAREIDTHGASW